MASSGVLSVFPTSHSNGMVLTADTCQCLGSFGKTTRHIGIEAKGVYRLWVAVQSRLIMDHAFRWLITTNDTSMALLWQWEWVNRAIGEIYIRARH